MAGSFLVNACAPIAAKAMESGQNNEPQILTPTTIPTFVTIPTSTEVPYQIPTLETVILTPTPEPILAPDVLYFSQLDYKNQFFKDGTPWSDASCGIMVDAMISKMQPLDFYKYFLDYFKSIGKDGEERITKLGSDLEDHKLVLESLGYTFVEIPSQDSNTDVKAEIKKYTDQGIPVLIKADVWTGYDWYGHYTIGIGIDKDGNIIYNDSVYGQGVTIAESSEAAALRSETHWIAPSQFFAVYPPQK